MRVNLFSPNLFRLSDFSEGKRACSIGYGHGGGVGAQIPLMEVHFWQLAANCAVLQTGRRQTFLAKSSCTSGRGRRAFGDWLGDEECVSARWANEERLAGQGAAFCPCCFIVGFDRSLSLSLFTAHHSERARERICSVYTILSGAASIGGASGSAARK